VTVRWTVVALLPLLATGCATKRDLRDLRQEMQTGREEMVRELRRQNEILLDSLNRQDIRNRGDMANRFLQLERQLVQIQELTGQGQQRLADLREQMNARAREAAAAAEAAPNPPQGSASAAAAGDPQELFNTSLAALRRGSQTTARAGFTEFLRLFPQHPLASDAQFHVGESFADANDPERALQAYARVIEQYPNAAKAPTALYRAGLLEVQRGNRAQARTLFNQVVRAYPRSTEAVSAREQLQTLGTR
jgi:tol-pal system protein YbgF